MDWTRQEEVEARIKANLQEFNKKNYMPRTAMNNQLQTKSTKMNKKTKIIKFIFDVLKVVAGFIAGGSIDQIF